MNKEKKLIIIIAVLCVLLFGCVGYIVFDKLNNKDNEVVDTDNEKEEEDKEEVRSLSADEEEMFLEKILDYNRGFSYYYPISDMSKIENFDLFSFSLKGVNSPASNDFTADDLDKTIEKYFDDSIKLKHEDYICKVDNKVLYKYDENTKTYSFNNEGHGHGGSQRAFISQFDIKIIGGEYNNGIYTVNAKVFYGNTCSDTCGPSSEFYSSYSDSINRGSAIIELKGQEFTEELAAQYRDKLPTTVYKFKKNSANNIVLFEVGFE